MTVELTDRIEMADSDDLSLDGMFELLDLSPPGLDMTLETDGFPRD